MPSSPVLAVMSITSWTVPGLQSASHPLCLTVTLDKLVCLRKDVGRDRVDLALHATDDVVAHGCYEGSFEGVNLL